jgi:hypothetical protein
MKQKLRLSMDELRVESHSTTVAAQADGGTVHGHGEAALGDVSGYATCLSACSATDGVFICKTCGPCC